MSGSSETIADEARTNWTHRADDGSLRVSIDDYKRIKADEAPAHVVEALVADACESQRAHGMIPTPIDNRQFVQPIVERLDNKPQRTHGKGSGRAEAIRAEYERRGGADFDSMEIRRDMPARAPGSPEAIPCTQSITLPTEEMAGLRARIRALGKHPAYRDRLKHQAVFVIGGQVARAAGDLTRARHLEGTAKDMLRAIVDESVREFGPWWKPAPKIIVG